MDFAFQNVVKFILRHSKLIVSLIRITKITEDSFHVSIEARTTNTGPASATLSAFTIDLCGPAGRFGQVHLPAITTHSDGAPIVVTDQLVRISDKAALQAFIQPVIVDSHAVLVLRDGHTTVRALGIGPKPVCYEKDMPMAGMNGPHVRVVSASAGAEGGDGDGDGNGNDTEKGNGLTFTIRVANPSPMEISFGECGFEIQNGAGEVFAELTGALDTRCGQFEATLRGTVNKHVSIGATTTTTTMSEKDKAAPAPAPTPARLVGKRCFGAGWCDETLRQIDTPLRGMRRIFEALNLPYEVSEEEEMENEKLLSDEKAPVARVVEEPVRAASKLWPSRFWRTTVS